MYGDLPQTKTLRLITISGIGLAVLMAVAGAHGINAQPGVVWLLGGMANPLTDGSKAKTEVVQEPEPPPLPTWVFQPADRIDMAAFQRTVQYRAVARKAAISPTRLDELLARPYATVFYQQQVDNVVRGLGPKSSKPSLEHLGQPYIVAQACRFASEYSVTLATAKRRYRVRPRDLVALLGAQSIFGTRQGQYLLFAANLSQIVDLAPAAERLEGGGSKARRRSKAARKRRALVRRNRDEAVDALAALIAAGERGGFDVTTVTGTWDGQVGAAGLPIEQLRFVVDADGDGKVDLAGGHDAILSAANALAVKGYAARSKGKRWKAFKAVTGSSETADLIFQSADKYKCRR